MFAECFTLRKVNISHFNTENVTKMNNMFSECSSLRKIYLSNFNTFKVKDMSEMFEYCSDLTTIYCNNAWNDENGYLMFKGCEKLKGAVPYNENNINGTMANPHTGYFTNVPTTVEGVRFGTDTAQQIYTLQGKRVRGEWKHLPAGVYVVNGKKTVKP